MMLEEERKIAQCKMKTQIKVRRDMLWMTIKEQTEEGRKQQSVNMQKAVRKLRLR